ncbi:MAG: methylamine methyltransferase corrinoid protein reductive activase [Methanomassiliicoccus sp.]|nr:methylamine methyltransferase corrinoid protein reductive activase [Methanomassiliicoccus sp.]
MNEVGIALDLGTSGFRGQAVDLSDGKTVSTAITVRHPLPGSNVIDHVNFAIEIGENEANSIIMEAVDRLIDHLGVDPSRISRVAVCGNPFQLSLFQNIEIRDLAFAGRRKLERLGVVPPRRDGDILQARALGLKSNPSAEVIIPPAVGHEIGADALAMLLLTGAMDEERPCMVIDYGTNAEMALVADGQVFTGSAAAGPALEGQEIAMGMLAAPGAISDVMIAGDGWVNLVLDSDLAAQEGDEVDPLNGSVRSQGIMHGRSRGITGTGVIAALASGIGTGLVSSSKIGTPTRNLYLQDGVTISESDVSEAGKAIGAIRAGYLTLMNKAGIWTDQVSTAFMSGATGLYVDARKAQRIGLVPPGAERIVQVGNTSLLMARELVMEPTRLDELRSFSTHLRATHCMFATSEMFKNIYSIELSLWAYGMPMSAYNDMLAIYKLPPIPLEPVEANVSRRMERDIPDLGPMGVTIVSDIGTELVIALDDCLSCKQCEKACREGAIRIENNDMGVGSAFIRSELCAGTACRRCEAVCRTKTLRLSRAKPLG